MAKILHVVNSFDPAGDVTRCVGELNKFSQHQHILAVKDFHPDQETYQFPTSVIVGDLCGLFKWCDAILYHFVGWERGWNSIGDGKPCGFRNSNIYYHALNNRFWSAGDYNAWSLKEYKLLASSHLGASDFLPGCKFLPAMFPIHEEQYTPDWTARPPCVSYSKHWEWLDTTSFGGIPRQSLHGVAHSELLRQRKHNASIVIDNISDGHYGLAGMEAMSLGLPFVCFNANKTKIQLNVMGEGEYPPIIEVLPNVRDIVNAVKNTEVTDALRRTCRYWITEHYDSKRLTKRYWEPFFEELLCQNGKSK